MTILEKGTVFARKYRLDRVIGKGGMGSVWAAHHTQLNMPLALKFMDPVADTPEARVRFEREARAAASLRSPHVVTILDHGVDDGVPFIAMELMEGEDLGDRLRRRKRLSLPEASKVLTQAAKALKRAHDAGILHRDLKPSNIFLARFDDDEVVKVLDFGVAKIQGPPGGDPNENATQTGIVFGSPSYMSPEQARGVRNLDHRTDLWSMAVIMFRAITGEKPFSGESIGDLVIKLCIDPLPVATRIAPDLPPMVDAFFERAFARDPKARFPTAVAMAQAFEAVVSNAGMKLLEETSGPIAASPSRSGANAMAGTPVSGSLLAPVSLTPAPPSFAPRPPENGPLSGPHALGGPPAAGNAREAAASLVDGPTVARPAAPPSGPHASGPHAASGPFAPPPYGQVAIQDTGASPFGIQPDLPTTPWSGREPPSDADGGALGAKGTFVMPRGAGAAYVQQARDLAAAPGHHEGSLRDPLHHEGSLRDPLHHEGSLRDPLHHQGSLPADEQQTHVNAGPNAAPWVQAIQAMPPAHAQPTAPFTPFAPARPAPANALAALWADESRRKLAALAGGAGILSIVLVILLISSFGGSGSGAAAPSAAPSEAPVPSATASAPVPEVAPPPSATASEAPSAPAAPPEEEPSASASASAAPSAPSAAPAHTSAPRPKSSSKPAPAPSQAGKKRHPNFGY